MENQCALYRRGKFMTRLHDVVVNDETGIGVPNEEFVFSGYGGTDLSRPFSDGIVCRYEWTARFSTPGKHNVTIVDLELTDQGRISWRWAHHTALNMSATADRIRSGAEPELSSIEVVVLLTAIQTFNSSPLWPEDHIVDSIWTLLSTSTARSVRAAASLTAPDLEAKGHRGALQYLRQHCQQELADLLADAENERDPWRLYCYAVGLGDTDRERAGHLFVDALLNCKDRLFETVEMAIYPSCDWPHLRRLQQVDRKRVAVLSVATALEGCIIAREAQGRSEN